MEIKRLKDLQTLVSLAKRRGIVFQSSEIYGGLGSCWDYGPLGSTFKYKIKQHWWQTMTRRRDVVGIDASILMHPQVWKSSGHCDGFTDPLVDCRDCKTRFREDHGAPNEGNPDQVLCPKCGSKNLTESRNFNLMFETHMGPVADEGSVVFLRPETAQGIFVNFDNVQTSTRKKIPFGIAQIGKSFRNEITPGNFIFRTREFEQMEMQYFVKEGSDIEWFEYWKNQREQFFLELGFDSAHIRFKPHGPKELAHYAKAASDIEYEFPFGWNEVEGVHNRGNFDLTQHQKYSGKKLEYFDEAAKEKYLPFVIETAIGCDRLALAVLCEAYHEEHSTLDNGKQDIRVLLKLKPKLAPITVACLPLSKKPPLQELAKKIYDDLSIDFDMDYDESSSIGKRYRRQDEVGTPLCLTVDFESIEDQSVTLRHRDTMEQWRVHVDQLQGAIVEQLRNF